MPEVKEIQIPFVFMNPFDHPEKYVVVIWINEFRTHQGNPVIVDWTAKAFLRHASEEQITNFLNGHLQYWSTIKPRGDGPEWNVRVGAPASTGVNGKEAVSRGIKAIRRLRGVFKSENRIIPGWALDACPEVVTSLYENMRSPYYGHELPILFCLPDASDKVFIEIIHLIQKKIAAYENVRMRRIDTRLVHVRDVKDDLFICVNPKLRHKKKLIESQGKKPWPHEIAVNGAAKTRIFHVEPVFQEVS